MRNRRVRDLQLITLYIKGYITELIFDALILANRQQLQHQAVPPAPKESHFIIDVYKG